MSGAFWKPGTSCALRQLSFCWQLCVCLQDTSYSQAHMRPWRDEALHIGNPVGSQEQPKAPGTPSSPPPRTCHSVHCVFAGT